MNQTMIIAFLLITVLCIEMGQGLSCYEHGYCIGRCPTLASSVVSCKSNQNKCWKLTSPLGTMRGCGDDRCRVQVDTGMLATANVCCANDLCNSATQRQITMGVIFTSLITFIYMWCT